MRPRLLPFFGIRCRGAVIAAGCRFDSREVSVGEGSYLNRRCIFSGGRAVIGRNCAIAHDVMFVMGGHLIGPHALRADISRGVGKPIDVGDGCWICARATILGGVTIGPGCVVAAGSVVTRDCEPDGLYAGVPARRVRDLAPDGELAWKQSMPSARSSYAP